MTAPATIAIVILPTLSEAKKPLDIVEFPAISAAEIKETKIEVMITAIRYNFAIFYEKSFSLKVLFCLSRKRRKFLVKFSLMRSSFIQYSLQRCTVLQNCQSR